jgi:hypothetical protein
VEVQVSYSRDYLIVFECLPIPTPAASSADPADPPERLPFDPRMAAGPAPVRPTLPGPMASDGPDPSHTKTAASSHPLSIGRTSEAVLSLSLPDGTLATFTCSSHLVH